MLRRGRRVEEVESFIEEGACLGTRFMRRRRKDVACMASMGFTACGITKR